MADGREGCKDSRDLGSALFVLATIASASATHRAALGVLVGGVNELDQFKLTWKIVPQLVEVTSLQLMRRWRLGCVVRRVISIPFFRQCL